ncbi:MAG: hypothetical protein ACYDDN_02585 [Candidatus Desulforudaceae bacterium]
MTRVEYERLDQCQQMDCPVMPDCAIYWGKECTKQHGNKVPRLRSGAFRRAKVRLAVPVVTEQIGRLGQVFWLRHPMQETFERAVDGE